MILAIDTATRWAGLALHDGTAVIAENGWRCLNTHTIELAPAIDHMFERVGITPSQLSGIAVAIGPGSYTGLRVGLALGKGLALAHQSPIIGVPTLDILAAAIGQLEGQLLLAAAAGRSRVCAGIYWWQPERGWTVARPPVIETWPNLLKGLKGDVSFAGEITQDAARLIQATADSFRLLSPAASTRRTGFLAEIGWQRLQRGEVDDARTLAPIYLRDPAGSKTGSGHKPPANG